MPYYDARCNNCDHEYTESRKWDGPVMACPICGGTGSTIWNTVPATVGLPYDPYDELNKPIPDPKPIKSFANDRRKGGKDTT